VVIIIIIINAVLKLFPLLHSVPLVHTSEVLKYEGCWQKLENAIVQTTVPMTGNY